MIKKILSAAVITAIVAVSQQAHAGTVAFEFNAPGVSGNGTFTVAPNIPAPADPNPLCGQPGQNACRSDPPSASKITGISGTFTDSTLGLFNVAITGLVPTNPANERDPTFDPIVPASLSFVGSSSASGTYFSYDNLFYPNGAPIVCAFPFTGTFLDPFGTAFTIANGDTVDLWGDGNFGPGSTLTYGVGVLSLNAQTGQYTKLVNDFAGVSATVPEPGSFALLGTGLMLLAGMTMGASRRKRPLNT